MTVLHFHTNYFAKHENLLPLRFLLIMTWNTLDSLKNQPPPFISSLFYWFILLTGGPPFKRMKRGLSSTPFFIYQRVIFIKTFERSHSGLILLCGAEVLLFQSKWSTKMNWFKPTLGFEMNFLWRALLSLSTTGRESKLYSSNCSSSKWSLIIFKPKRDFSSRYFSIGFNAWWVRTTLN